MFANIAPGTGYHHEHEFRAEFDALCALSLEELQRRVRAASLSCSTRDLTLARRLAFALCGGRKLRLADCNKFAPAWISTVSRIDCFDGGIVPPTAAGALPSPERARRHALEVFGDEESARRYLADVGASEALRLATLLVPARTVTHPPCA